MKRVLVLSMLICAATLSAASIERPITAVADSDAITASAGNVQLQVVRGNSTVTVIRGSVPPATSTAMRAGERDRDSWRGGRAIVVDSESRKLRVPTQAETDQLVQTLRQLTVKSSSVVIVNADGSQEASGEFDQVVIARPTEEGTMETLCVGSFEEAAQFLGLVKKPATTEGK